MAYSPDYPADNNREPGGRRDLGRSREASATWQLRQRSERASVSTTRVLRYNNTQYNN